MYRNVAFSGGGAHTLAFVGAIKYLEEKGHVKNVRNIIGASGGTFFALLLFLNWSYERIHAYCTTDLVKYLGQNIVTVASLIKLPYHYGLNDGRVIIDIVEDVLTKSGVDKDATFIDLAKLFGKHIVIATTNVTQKRIEYLSVDTEPDMKVTTAVRMSTSIPILFTPVKYYDDLYVDSLIYNNFPVDFFTQFTVDTLGININVLEKKQYPRNFFAYMSTIYNCLYDSVMKKRGDGIRSDCKICNVDIDESVKKFDLYNMRFDVTPARVNELKDKGYDALMRAFENVE